MLYVYEAPLFTEINGEILGSVEVLPSWWSFFMYKYNLLYLTWIFLHCTYHCVKSHLNSWRCKI